VENGAGWHRSHPTSQCFRNSPAAYTAIHPIAAPPAMNNTRLISATPVAGPEKSNDEEVNPIRWKSGPTPLRSPLGASRNKPRASGHRIYGRTDELADIAFGRRLHWPTLPNSEPGNETSSLCCLFLGFSVLLVSDLQSHIKTLNFAANM
jgi:hypothetical protein